MRERVRGNFMVRFPNAVLSKNWKGVDDDKNQWNSIEILWKRWNFKGQNKNYWKSMSEWVKK